MVENILRNARRRVAAGWCQGEDARDANGDRVEFWSNDARTWSLLGALVVPAHDTTPGRLSTRHCTRAASELRGGTPFGRSRDEELGAQFRTVKPPGARTPFGPSPSSES